MTTYRAWAQLGFEAREEWCNVFPDGKVPVKTKAVQKIRFDGVKDPESVFSVDWEKMAIWQQEALFEKLSLDGLAKMELFRIGFSFGRTIFCCFGSLYASFRR